jgi:hypothetical protein
MVLIGSKSKGKRALVRAESGLKPLLVRVLSEGGELVIV